LSSVRSATVTEPRSSLPQTQKEQAGGNAGQNPSSKKNKAGGNAGLVLFDAVRSPLGEDRRQRRGAVDDDLASVLSRVPVVHHNLATKG
jgi:hypothetical protein